MDTEKKIGFLGMGNMGYAILKGLMESKSFEPSHILASDKRKEALDRVSREYSIKILNSNRDLVAGSDVIIIAVKPQNIDEVLKEIKDRIKEDQLLISIAAGIPLRKIRDLIGKDLPMIRVMPNTPALVQKGATALSRGQITREKHMEFAKKIFEPVGETVEVEEDLMDAVTAVSGSGPGFVFRIMEHMVDAALSVGLEREVALDLVLQTFLGAAYLAKHSKEPLSRLREMVTSPGGTTAAGLAVMDEMGLGELIRKVIEAAWRRSRELGEK